MSFLVDKSRLHTVETQMDRFTGAYSFCIAVSLSVIHLVVETGERNNRIHLVTSYSCEKQMNYHALPHSVKYYVNKSYTNIEIISTDFTLFKFLKN